MAIEYAGDCAVAVYARKPVPPFPILEGPFCPGRTRRPYAISDVETADCEIATSDITDPRWLLPGACWSIESTCEPIWVGFIRPGEVQMASDSVSLQLEGPTALLDIEVGVSEKLHLDLGSTIAEFLTAAQSRSPIGVYAGEVLHSTSLDTSIRGETILGFVKSASEQLSLDWRIRTIQNEDSNVMFYLDIGPMRRPVPVVIVKDDIIAGIFRQRPIAGSVTAFGAAQSFDERRASTVSNFAQGVSGGDKLTYPTEGGMQDVLNARNIGPAASVHRFQFLERTSGGVPEVATRKMTQELRGIDEMIISLDQATFRDLQPGDIVRLNVAEWIPELTVKGLFQVRRTEPDEEVGDKEVMLWSIL